MGSVVSPVDSTPAAPAESGGSGSARGHSASGQAVVPKFTGQRNSCSSSLLNVSFDRLLAFALLML